MWINVLLSSGRPCHWPLGMKHKALILARKFKFVAAAEIKAVAEWWRHSRSTKRLVRTCVIRCVKRSRVGQNLMQRKKQSVREFSILLRFTQSVWTSLKYLRGKSWNWAYGWPWGWCRVVARLPSSPLIWVQMYLVPELLTNYFTKSALYSQIVCDSLLIEIVWS